MGEAPGRGGSPLGRKLNQALKCKYTIKQYEAPVLLIDGRPGCSMRPLILTDGSLQPQHGRCSATLLVATVGAVMDFLGDKSYLRTAKWSRAVSETSTSSARCTRHRHPIRSFSRFQMWGMVVALGGGAWGFVRQIETRRASFHMCSEGQPEPRHYTPPPTLLEPTAPPLTRHTHTCDQARLPTVLYFVM